VTASLGELSIVDARTVWPSESSDFTPWLAGDSNLELLGDSLGLELELVGTEIQVGPYSADLLAKDTANDRNVVIENQLEKTDHDHLGKALTYGAMLSASVVVWIAREFTDEHRKTLDWLNDHTGDDLDFFGVCIELWRIGESLPAPRFNVVSRPSYLFKQGRTGGSTQQVTETRRLQLEFWSALRDRLSEASVLPSLQTPRPQYWYSIALGRSQIHLSCIANTSENRIGVRLYLRHRVADLALAQLEPQKEAIEREMGMELLWNPYPEKQDKIVLADRPADLGKREEWSEYLDWTVGTVVAFRKAFRDRVKALDLTPTPAEEAED